MIIRIANIKNEKELINSEYALLSQKNKAEFDKIISQKREESLLGRALVRQLFKENGYTKTVFFKKTVNGKPFTVPKCMYFSISHSQGAVAACVSHKNIGIDIEVIREIDLKLSNKVCTQDEKTWIFAADSREESVKRFFILWTLKESYMKVTGKGMLIPFNSIPFEITDDYRIIKCVNGYDFTVEFRDNIVISAAEKR